MAESRELQGVIYKRRNSQGSVVVTQEANGFAVWQFTVKSTSPCGLSLLPTLEDAVEKAVALWTDLLAAEPPAEAGKETSDGQPPAEPRQSSRKAK